MYKETIFNVNQITSITIEDKQESKRIKYHEYNKSFWEGTVKEGFYHELGLDTILIEAHMMNDYNEYIFDYSTKKAYYKPNILITMSNDDYFREYYNTFEEARLRYKQIINTDSKFLTVIND